MKFEKTQLCICPTIEKRNETISILNQNKIRFEKKVKREKSILKTDIKENEFGIVYIIYVSKEDYEKAENLLKKDLIEVN